MRSNYWIRLLSFLSLSKGEWQKQIILLINLTSRENENWQKLNTTKFTEIQIGLFTKKEYISTESKVYDSKTRSSQKNIFYCPQSQN